MFQNDGPVPVAPIREYIENEAHGYVVDMIHTLQHQILAHPERSRYIKNLIPSFREDGIISNLEHTQVVCYHSYRSTFC